MDKPSHRSNFHNINGDRRHDLTVIANFILLNATMLGNIIAVLVSEGTRLDCLFLDNGPVWRTA